MFEIKAYWSNQDANTKGVIITLLIILIVISLNAERFNAFIKAGNEHRVLTDKQKIHKLIYGTIED